MADDSAQKMILIADYGRSGQGWLSYMLCYILNAHYVEPYDLLKGRLYSSSEHILRLTRGNLPGRDKTRYSHVVKTHNYPACDLNLTDKIILLKRDPRDVAVSAYNMKRNLRMSGARLSLKSTLELMLHSVSVMSHIVTLKKWVNFYRAWSHVQVHNVSYEGLSADARTELIKILNYLDVPIDDKLIDDAIELFSFKKITGRNKGDEFAASSEFRKGVVGDYKRVFSRAELIVMRPMFSKLFARHGYVFE